MMPSFRVLNRLLRVLKSARRALDRVNPGDVGSPTTVTTSYEVVSPAELPADGRFVRQRYSIPAHAEAGPGGAAGERARVERPGPEFWAGFRDWQQRELDYYQYVVLPGEITHEFYRYQREGNEHWHRNQHRGAKYWDGFHTAMLLPLRELCGPDPQPDSDVDSESDAEFGPRW